MTRVEEFDTFYSSTRRYMLHVTYALCGDRNAAAAAVADAYRRAWQQWPKLRGRDPMAYLRNEAWRLSVLERGKHPWRRRQEEDSDLGLIAALHKLPPSSRRLVVLQSIGEIDLESAARDVGLPNQAAADATQEGIRALETSMATDLEDIEQRLRGLARISDLLTLPRPHGLRRDARRRTRRNTVTAVAVVVAAVLTAGLVATESAPMNHAEASPTREQLGAETAQATPVGVQIDADQLLDSKAISRLHQARQWTAGETEIDSSATEPYTICAPRRFSDRKAHDTYVRSFSASGPKDEAAIEAIEVSRSPKAAERTYERMLKWYSTCAVPRVQLISSYTVNRPDGDTEIFRLRLRQGPTRTFTVAVSRTGVATSALIHSVNGSRGVDIDDFAATVRRSLAAVCADAGGRCATGGSVHETLPAPASSAEPFLSVVDLPPVANIDDVWVGTDPVKAKPNPAATLCDNAKFTGKKVQKARSRVFVIPKAKRLPKEFGLSETVGRFNRPKAAKAFVRSVGDKIESCEKDNLSASIGRTSKVSGEDDSGVKITGKTWKVAFEIDNDENVYYRVALVRRGRSVAQVSFSPTKRFDIAPAAFDRLARRSGERLAYLQ